MVPATLELAAAFSLRLVTASEETIAGEVALPPNVRVSGIFRCQSFFPSRSKQIRPNEPK